MTSKGCNAEGHWVDDLDYGWDDSIVNIVYFQDENVLVFITDNSFGRFESQLLMYNFTSMQIMPIPLFAPQAFDQMDWTPPTSANTRMAE